MVFEKFKLTAEERAAFLAIKREQATPEQFGLAEKASLRTGYTFWRLLAIVCAVAEWVEKGVSDDES
jgi:hypothetical protein